MKYFKLIITFLFLSFMIQNVLLAQWQWIDTPVYPNPTGFSSGVYCGDPASGSTLYWAYTLYYPNRSYDSYFKIFKSIDTGDTWTVVEAQAYNSASLYEVSFISADTGFFNRNEYTQNLISRTSNGLQTSVPTYGIPEFPIYNYLHMVSLDKMYAIHYTKQFLKLENDTFKVVSAFNANLVFYYSKIETTPDETIFVTCGSNLLNSYKSYMILKSQDFGFNWDTVYSDTSSSILDIEFISNNLGVGVGHNGLVVKTEDAGNTWNVEQSYTTNDLFSVDCVNDSVWIAAGQSGTIISSNDRGLTWNNLESPTTQKLNKVKWHDIDGYIFVQSSNQLWRAKYDVITNISSKHEIEKYVSIYPNPAQQVINISLDGHEVDEVNIYSIAGRKLLGERPAHNSVNISKLPQGIYIAELVFENKKIRQKIVVQR